MSETLQYGLTAVIVVAILAAVSLIAYAFWLTSRGQREICKAVDDPANHTFPFSADPPAIEEVGSPGSKEFIQFRTCRRGWRQAAVVGRTGKRRIRIFAGGRFGTVKVRRGGWNVSPSESSIP
ncbi:hypothetical protein C4571_01750 [Candidatus Parcubacteria bacterium]|nr:MAG: hypothetical protein C4571_01750 [Candidatus Parcubacteria bacterium]